MAALQRTLRSSLSSVAKKREERPLPAVGNRRGLLALALFVTLAARVFWVAVVAPSPGIDFFQFWAVARAEASGGLADPYSDEARSALAETGKKLVAQTPGSQHLAMAVEYREHIETFSTPFLYMVVGALSSADYDASLDRFALLRVVCLIAGVAVLCRLAGCDPWLTGLWLLATLWFSEPVRSDARVGNVNAVQLAGLAGYLALARVPSDRGQAAAGATLGLLIAFKPTLGLVAAFLAIDWVAAARVAPTRAAGRVVRGGGPRGRGGVERMVRLGAGLAGLARGAAAARTRGRRLGGERELRAGAAREASSARQCRRARSSQRSRWRSPAVAGSARAAPSRRRALRATSWWRRSAARRPSSASQLGWLHYFLLVAPLAIYLFAALADPRALAAVALASLLVLGTPVRVFGPGLSSHWQAAAYLAGALGLFALGLVELARPRSPLTLVERRDGRSCEAERGPPRARAQATEARAASRRRAKLVRPVFQLLG